MSNPDPMPEPSMEEILASIRQIIAEGEEPPAAGQKPAAPRPAPQPRLAPEAKSRPPEPEPSYEDEDDPYAVAAGQAGGSEDDDVFDLTDEMMAEPGSSEPIPFPLSPAVEEPADAGYQDEDEPEAASFDDPPAAARASSADDELEFRSPPPRAGRNGAGPQPAAESAFAGGRAGAGAQAGEPEEGEDPLLSAAAGQAVAEAFGRLTRRTPSNDGRTIEELVVDMLRPMLKEWLDDNLPLLVERLVRDEIERVTRGRR